MSEKTTKCTDKTGTGLLYGNKEFFETFFSHVLFRSDISFFLKIE